MYLLKIYLRFIKKIENLESSLDKINKTADDKFEELDNVLQKQSESNKITDDKFQELEHRLNIHKLILWTTCGYCIGDFAGILTTVFF